MFETVTVEEAIAKGRRTIKYPQFVIFFTIIILSVALESVYEVSVAYLAIGMFMAIALTWLYWSMNIVRWQIWAFNNVRNVHALRRKAIKERLIWPEGIWIGNTQLWSPEQRKKWAALETKFNQPDIFTDDLTVPQESLIYYSKVKNLLEMVFMLGLLGFGVYMIIHERSYWWGGFISLIGAALAFSEFKQATNTNVQIRINDEGIETAEAKFHSWEFVYSEDVIRKRSGKNTYTYLIYDYPEGTVELSIDDFKITKKQLEHLLEVYRGRYENKGMIVSERSKSTSLA